MRKVITCKVIRTIPLNSSDAVRSSSGLKDKSYNIHNAARGPMANQWSSEMSVNPQAEQACKTILYTNNMKISRIPIDNGFTASTINCYA